MEINIKQISDVFNEFSMGLGECIKCHKITVKSISLYDNGRLTWDNDSWNNKCISFDYDEMNFYIQKNIISEIFFERCRFKRFESSHVDDCLVAIKSQIEKSEEFLVKKIRWYFDDNSILNIIHIVIENEKYYKHMGKSYYEVLIYPFEHRIYQLVDIFIDNLFEYIFTSMHKHPRINVVNETNLLLVKSVNYMLHLLGLPEQSILTYLSSLKYELAPNNSSFYFKEHDHDVCYSIRFVNQPAIQPNRGREIRKLMSIAERGYMIVVSYGENRIIGITKSAIMPSFTIEFKYLQWILKRNNNPIISYVDGKFVLPNYRDEDTFYIDKLRRFFVQEDFDKIKKLIEVINVIKQQQHGTTLVVAEDAEKETERLCSLNRGIKIYPINLLVDKSLILNITSIDGAIIIDKNCMCYGLGLILDGEAIIEGDVSRGARYNSVNNYIRIKKEFSKKYLAIVISEDGMIDVIF